MYVCVCVWCVCLNMACPFDLAALQTHTERRFCVPRQEACFHLSRLGQLPPPRTPAPPTETKGSRVGWVTGTRLGGSSLAEEGSGVYICEYREGGISERSWNFKELKRAYLLFFFFHLIESNKSIQAFNDIPLCLEVREHVRARPQALALNGFTYRSGIVAGVSWLQITLCDFIQKSGRESRSLLSGMCVWLWLWNHVNTLTPHPETGIKSACF